MPVPVPNNAAVSITIAHGIVSATAITITITITIGSLLIVTIYVTINITRRGLTHDKKAMSPRGMCCTQGGRRLSARERGPLSFVLVVASEEGLGLASCR